jgi:hypothetical protein
VPREIARLQSTIEASRGSWDALILTQEMVYIPALDGSCNAAQGPALDRSKYTGCTASGGCCASATAHRQCGLSGITDTAGSSPSASSQLLAPSCSIPCRPNSFTTILNNKGLAAVRWRNDPGEIVWQGSLSKALCEIDCHARLRQIRQCKLYTLAIRAQSPGKIVRSFLVHFCPAFRIDTSRGALGGVKALANVHF